MNGTFPTTGKELPVGTEGHTIDPASVSLKGMAKFARSYIPQANGTVVAFTTGKDPAIEIKSHTADRSSVPLKSVEKFARGYIPQPNSRVDSGTGKGTTVVD